MAHEAVKLRLTCCKSSYTEGEETERTMDTPRTPPPSAEGVPGPLTPEKVRRFRARVAAVHEHLCARGVDPTQLPDPVEELIKARDAAGWE
jgi:hypothetical protein